MALELQLVLFVLQLVPSPFATGAGGGCCSPGAASALPFPSSSLSSLSPYSLQLFNRAHGSTWPLEGEHLGCVYVRFLLVHHLCHRPVHAVAAVEVIDLHNPLGHNIYQIPV